MSRGFFITGTDTDVGKTTVALGLIRAFSDAGLRVAAMKPVSAGCDRTPHGLRNQDALRLMQQVNVCQPYDVVNPYAFEAAIAPHIAAAEQHITMDIEAIAQAYQFLATNADVIIVEGAGGWLTPLNPAQTMAHVAAALELDVIQVVGLKLGCLNHALLTAASISAQGLQQVGWVANQVSEPMPHQQENIHTLQQRLPGTFLGELGHCLHPHDDMPDPGLVATALQLEGLLIHN